jgi:predicted fused transcriptional regulator/phosphomethylpyrimidine kinase
MHIDDNKKFDKRTIEKNLKEGIVSVEEWEKFLRTLPDVSDNVDFIMPEEEKTEDTTKEKGMKSKGSIEKEVIPEGE